MYSRLIAAALTLAVTSAASAAEQGPTTGDFYLAPLGSYYLLPEEQGYDGDAFGWGGALGYTFHENWAAEVSYLDYDQADLELPGGITQTEQVQAVWLNLLYLIPSDWFFQPYAVVGGGRGSYNRNDLGTDRDLNEYNAGLGLYKNLSERVSVRGDVRGHYVHHDDSDFTAVATLGLVFTLGRIEHEAAPVVAAPPPPAPAPAPAKCPDEDNDGVCDANDACPGTPAGTRVGSAGCDCDFVMRLQFAFDSDELTVDDKAQLDQLAARLNDPRLSFVAGEIVGHTDSIGDDAYNMDLSKRRANSVTEYLRGKGVKLADRFEATGMGETKPLADNGTEEGRAQNRRVTIRRQDCGPG